MARVLIWDLPTRLFHWILVCGLLAAFAIAQFGGEHGPLFPYHAMIGVVLGLLLILRLIWGLVGTRHARFASLAFGPGAVAAYFKGILTGQPSRHPAHNPASSWAIILMLILLASIIASGLLTAWGYEAFEEIHTIAVYALLAVAGIHVAGVLLHTVRHRENITLGMITGRKLADAASAIPSAAPLAGLLLLAIVVLFAVGLHRNFDPVAKQTTLPLLGTSIPLSEPDHDHADRAGEHHRR